MPVYIHTYVHTIKFLTCHTCQFTSESVMTPKQLRVARFKQFSFKPVLKCQKVSAERAWTPREFQTVGLVAQNAVAANDVVAGCCCRRRAEVERGVLEGW